MLLSDLLLHEYSASRTEFSQILNDPSVRMGFECEMVSTEFTDGDEDDYGNEDGQDDEDDDDDEYQQDMEDYHQAYADWENWEDEDEPDFGDMTFAQMEATEGVTIDPRDRRRLMQEYNEWKHARLRAEWEQARPSYLSAYLKRHPDRVSNDAYHSWIAARSERLPNPDNNDEEEPPDSLDAFIRETYGNMTQFMTDVGIEWEPENQRPEEPTIPDRPERDRYDRGSRSRPSNDAHAEIADSLASALGVKTTTKHSSNLDVWRVINDESIQGDGVGAEVVSGVYPLKEGLDKLKQCFRWMNGNGMKTNTSTGLHVSFSIAGITSDQDYDFLKMMMFFDENYTAELFGRLNQLYAKQMRDVLFHDMQNNDPATVMRSRNISAIIGALKKLGKSLPSQLGHEKYHSFRHRANGVIEFRNMGSSDYETKFETIRNRIINMAYVVKLGADPVRSQREYLLHIYKMLTSNKFSDPSLTQQNAPSASVKVPYSLNTFSSIIQRSNMMMSYIKQGDFVRLLKTLLDTVDAAALTKAQLRQLRYAMAKNKMSPATVRNMINHDARYNRIANRMHWPLVVPGDHPAEQEILPFVKSGNDRSGQPMATDGYSHTDRIRDQHHDRLQLDLPRDVRSTTYGLHRHAQGHDDSL